MRPENVALFFSHLAAAILNPRTELHYRSTYELLVAVTLSAQATDTAVNIATERLFQIANTPASMLALGQAGLEQQIKSIGLYRSKAKHIIQAAQLLLEQHQGEVPRQREALQALPGVGRKTANVILNTAFDEPVIAVDTHIFRIANRSGLAPAKTPETVETALMRVVPTPFLKDAHHLLILHGRYTCTARKPHCAACPVYLQCEWPEKNQGRTSNP